MSDQQEETKRRIQGRSPPFPFIPLGKAVERARELESYSRGHPIRPASAVSAWKYNPKSSGGIQTLAALKAFGFLTEVADSERRVQLTEEARRLFRNPPEPIRLQILQKSALTPKLIKECWGDWGAKRPPDDECLWTLQDVRGFTPDAANRFLSIYDATISYARLTASANIMGVASDIEEDIDGEMEQPGQAPISAALSSASLECQTGVALMPGERIVFTEESGPERYIKVVAVGEIDETLLEALTDFVKRQRKRLRLPTQSDERSDDPATQSTVADHDQRISVASAEGRDSGGVSFFITQAQKTQLRDRGYTDEQIREMKPEEAYKALGLTN